MLKELKSNIRSRDAKLLTVPRVESPGFTRRVQDSRNDRNYHHRVEIIAVSC